MGSIDGNPEGRNVGSREGIPVGLIDGRRDGLVVGRADGAPVGNRKLERSAQEERPPKDISSVHIPPTSPTGALPAPVEQLASDISTIRPPKVKATSFRLGDRKRPGSSGFSTSPRASPVRGREFGRAQGPGLSGPQTRPPGDKKDFLKRATSTQATASR